MTARHVRFAPQILAAALTGAALSREYGRVIPVPFFDLPEHAPGTDAHAARFALLQSVKRRATDGTLGRPTAYDRALRAWHADELGQVLPGVLGAAGEQVLPGVLGAGGEPSPHCLHKRAVPA